MHAIHWITMRGGTEINGTRTRRGNATVITKGYLLPSYKMQSNEGLNSRMKWQCIHSITQFKNHFSQIAVRFLPFLLSPKTFVPCWTFDKTRRMLGLTHTSTIGRLSTIRGLFHSNSRHIGQLPGLRGQTIEEPISISLKASALPWDAEALAEKSFFAQHRPLLQGPPMGPPMGSLSGGSSWPPSSSSTGVSYRCY
jgi:hypothetical protein